MKIVDATLEDGKMCAQLQNLLKIMKLPDLAMADLEAIMATKSWFNSFVKALASDLQAQNDKKKEVQKPILPEPKVVSKAKGKAAKNK